MHSKVMWWGMRRIALFSLVAIGPLSFSARGEVKLASVFADHMVLQRQLPVHIWGWAEAQEPVSATFRGEAQRTIADSAGHWDIYFQPREAGGPFQLEVTGTNRLHVSDILVGDLWIASGQSNMEMPLGGWGAAAQVKDAAQEIAAADHRDLRFFTVAETSSPYPLDEVLSDASWQLCSPATATSLSAVAYFFARDLQQHEQVPLGIIVTSWGGTPIEAWTSIRALSAEPSLAPAFRFADVLSRRHSASLRVSAAEAEGDRAMQAAGKPVTVHPDRRNELSWQPGALFNGMIAPLTPLAVKGVVWYQGESNTDHNRAPLYARALPTMIADWRREWRQPDLPFLYVQISSFGLAAPSPWSVVREAQRRTLAVAGTAMIVSADVGDAENVHPPDKQTVGYRLALAARATVYRQPIEFSGPTLRYVVTTGGKIVVWFDHANGLKSIRTGVAGFEVAGTDRKFMSASAKIVGESVVVDCPSIARPLYVRYAWPPASAMSLYNSDGLPASPFSSDDDYDSAESVVE